MRSASSPAAHVIYGVSPTVSVTGMICNFHYRYYEGELGTVFFDVDPILHSLITFSLTVFSTTKQHTNNYSLMSIGETCPKSLIGRRHTRNTCITFKKFTIAYNVTNKDN